MSTDTSTAGFPKWQPEKNHEDKVAANHGDFGDDPRDFERKNGLYPYIEPDWIYDIYNRRR